MHPSLRLQNFSKLPIPLRRIANSAATGSVQDLRLLCTRIPIIPKSQATLLLPAFYANLDPAGIPERLDENEQISPAVSCAIESIRGLYSGLPILNAALPNIWPRFWPWVDFLRPYLGTFSGFGEDEFYVNFVVFVEPFTPDEMACSLMGATSGVRFMLAKAWRAIMRLRNDERRRLRITAFNGLFGCILTPTLDASTPPGLAEFIDGAGGSTEHLASLVISFFDHLAPTPRTILAVREVDFLRAVFSFMKTTDHVVDGNQNVDRYALHRAMKSQGLARVLATTICALAASTVDGVDIVLYNCMTTLGMNSYTPSMQRWLAEALKYGLLRGMLVSSNYNPNAMYHGPITGLLTDLLTPALLYHTVVARLEAALSDLGDLPRTSSLANRAEWRQFIALAQERLGVLKSLDSVEWASYKACDNLRCGKIRHGHNCARCGSCRNAYYCSRDCQATDWREGHKRICSTDAQLSLNEFQDFTWHDRAFVRAVLHRDYLNMRPEIARARAAFLQRFPGQQSFVLFSYMWGRVVVDVQATRGWLVPAELKTTEWEARISRALGSGGREELHVILMKEGTGRHYFLVPLHRSQPELDSRRLARDVGPAGDAAEPDDIDKPTEIH
ncbi:hypothetical protein FB451DRAFT_1274831 [Mycena latifolia]|nr:hypothetical protein FB451DRAFT_1274831 [Mycena latifolia]